MAIGINDLDDDDYGTGFEPTQQLQQPEPPVVTPLLSSNLDDSFVSDFLKTKGIDDISKIKFEDENGNIEERSWDSLTREEQFNILNTPLEPQAVDNSNSDLSDEEIQFLNQLRQNNA